MSRQSKFNRANKKRTESNLTAYVNTSGEVVLEFPGEQMQVLPPELTPWTPFQAAEIDKNDHIRHGFDPEDVSCFTNSRYQVVKYDNVPMYSGDTRLTWLSIKRLDKESCHDWRDFQRIKNELCGESRFGVEVYPPESELVDVSNQYHLWVFPEGLRLPFGFANRQVAGAEGNGVESESSESGAKQRTFENAPSDMSSLEEAEKIERGIGNE